MAEPTVNWQTLNSQLQALTETIFSRQMLLSSLDPDRDLNYSLHYHDDNALTADRYKEMYDREGIAQRVVQVYPEECWSTPPRIYETEGADLTPFEQAWDEIEKTFHLLHYMERADILSGIGRFGILVFGLDDGGSLSDPVPGFDEKTGLSSLRKKPLRLLYLRTFPESCVNIESLENDVNSPRYGFPKYYTIKFQTDVVSSMQESSNKQVRVHWTRVLHVADNREDSEVYGVPRMKSVWNRLLDIRKILGGSGEMYWQGAFPGLAFERQVGYENAAVDEDAMRQTVQDYMNGLQRYLNLVGVTAKSLPPQVVSPEGHLLCQIRAIALSKGVPYRVFLGTEEAKLSSSQDIKVWNRRLMKRHSSYLTPMIVRPTLDRLIAYGILPPASYIIDWPDLNTLSDSERAKVAKDQTEAMVKYVSGGVDTFIPPRQYLSWVLQMPPEKVDLIEKEMSEWVEGIEGEQVPMGEEEIQGRKDEGARREKEIEEEK